MNFILFSIYDYSFFGYCFDRNDCLVENSANLTARQDYFNENFNLFGKVPAHVCSCIPAWLWFVASVCQFLSHHLDGTDGKQARRTQSSSPLGELFDHGLDSWSTLFLPVALFSIFGRSEPFGVSAFHMYGIMWLIMGSFIISHWEKYNTGILFLPWSYDLSQVGMTVLFLLTSLFGQKVWYFYIGPYTSTQLIEIIIYGKFLTILIIYSFIKFCFLFKYFHLVYLYHFQSIICICKLIYYK
jgi:ethanolaminephosphotransferase